MDFNVDYHPYIQIGFTFSQIYAIHFSCNLPYQSNYLYFLYLITYYQNKFLRAIARYIFVFNLNCVRNFFHFLITLNRH
jgi:hypothetical protein